MRVCGLGTLRHRSPFSSGGVLQTISAPVTHCLVVGNSNKVPRHFWLGMTSAEDSLPAVGGSNVDRFLLVKENAFTGPTV